MSEADAVSEECLEVEDVADEFKGEGEDQEGNEDDDYDEEDDGEGD